MTATSPARTPSGATSPAHAPFGATSPATRVLIVDDEPHIVRMLRFALEAHGYRTFAARDGLEAVKAVDEHRPAVMLLDIMMPVMDGWAVLGRLRDLPAEERPRVIVVSALTRLRDRTMALELGADAFVAKPFNIDDLLLLLRDLGRAS